ncbi:MAG: ribosomal protein S18-alanine N-acetyltransferase [Corallococcus sp.]|nr:ribosomal protein S18-alanine N-acetyltransferase [Bacillota bacterium]MCM1534020.1 ribosomal protein S18-alanine N-acetyltransferase [Corallococcus sp.]
MIQELTFSMQNIFQLADLEKECFGKDAWTIANLRGEFGNSFSHFFAEVIDDKIVGYACVRIMYEESQICNICVATKYRRQGIASRILQEVAVFSKEQNCERCELEVNVANEPAVELYKHCGYVVEGIRKDFYRRTRYSTRDAYTMVLQL